MISFAARRLCWALATAFVASIVAFLLFWTIPNVNPEYWLGGGTKGTNETRALAVEKYGLDDPLPEQYVRLMKAILNGDVECFYGCGSLRSAFSRPFRSPSGSSVAQRCSRSPPESRSRWSVFDIGADGRIG